ncbi:MAG: prenyltransferase [Bacillota bacterium]
MPGSSRWADWLEFVRPFSLTASLIPVLAGGALAWQEQKLLGWAFVASLLAGVLVQIGTNLVNEVYDVANGVDRLDSPRASHVVVQGRISPATGLRGAGLAFGLAALLGALLAWVRGAPMLVIGAVGIVSGYFYTAPPVHFKYRALGVPGVFVLMGPLMVLGAYVASAGPVSSRAVLAGVPVGFLVASILHANELRDLEDDSKGPFRTLTSVIGRPAAAWLYVGMVAGAYGSLLLLAATGALPWPTLVTFLTAPAAVRNCRRALAGARGQPEAITWLDIASAKVHLQFGLLLAAGIVAAGLVERVFE